MLVIAGGFLVAGCAVAPATPTPTVAPTAAATPVSAAPASSTAAPAVAVTPRPSDTPRPATPTAGPTVAGSPSPLASPAAAPGFGSVAPVTAGPTAGAGCPGAIAWSQAKDRVGQQATVSGQVARTNYASNTRGQPTFVDLGVGFPDRNRFTVVIWGSNRGAFPSPPELLYRGRTVCVSGRIDVFEGIPQIEVTSPAAIRIVP